MAKRWDESLKHLVQADPQAFVHWLLPQASFRSSRPVELLARTLEMDALLEVTVNEKPMLLHIEFQTYHDPAMPERMLRYNVLTCIEQKLPVLSCVLYLLDDGQVPLPTVIWYVPTGQEVLRFSFHQVERAKLSVQDIKETQQVGLLPLLPLTRDGASREVVTSMFADLLAEQKVELVPIGYALASLVFRQKEEAEQVWLLRRFHDMHDLLRDTPIYQEILREGREEGQQEGQRLGEKVGREEGRKVGREEGQIKALQDMIHVLLVERFPQLLSLAKQQLPFFTDVILLQRTALKLSLAQSVDEARDLLLIVNPI